MTPPRGDGAPWPFATPVAALISPPPNRHARSVFSPVPDAFFERDPFGAALVARSYHDHVTESTRSSYTTGAKSYLRYCEIYRLVPWPVPAHQYNGWLVYSMNLISVDSLLGVYAAGVRDTSDLLGQPWTLDGHPLVRKTIRFVQRRRGAKPKLIKVPLRLAYVVAIAKLLPGWPVLATMDHDGLLWLTAAVCAVLGMLRGGEFLVSPRGGRVLLRHRDVSMTSLAGVGAIEFFIDRPKAAFWELGVICRVMDPDAGSLLRPVELMKAYRAKAGPLLFADGPAFVHADGKALSKAWMLRRTEQLMIQAGVTLYDARGHMVRPRASCFRSGGVDTALKAGVPRNVIKAQGRWKSDAWASYASAAEHADLSDAARLMWAATIAAPHQDGPRVERVSVPPAEGFEEPELPLTDGEDEGDGAAPDSSPAPEVEDGAPRRYKRGDVVMTRWGAATIVRVRSQAKRKYVCTLLDSEEEFRLRLVDDDHPGLGADGGANDTPVVGV